ncbi:MAG: NADH dehydrogenase [Caldivirga sp. MG_3]|jgi:NADH-quinone oxidoreductase subunit D|nr:MAG: NADH dehydrogenase [Caldivirga sp. MG_3]
MVMSEREVSINVPVELPTEVKSLFLPIPKNMVEEVYRSDEYLVLIGPAHPGSGHMRIILRLKGDYIVEAIPDPGYVHRAVEKLAETRLFVHNIPLVERPTIAESSIMDHGYVRAIEELGQLDVPPRAQYLRVIMDELSRIGDHLYDTGILAVFLGHSTGYMWGFGLREFIVDALARMTGARITVSFVIPSGVRWDVHPDTLRYIYNMTFFIEKKIDELGTIFTKNPVTVSRMKGVGVLTKDECIRFGAVGPFLRACGVEYDNRKVRPYAVYDQLEWEVPVADEGDAYSRFLVRVEEIRQSLNIIRQAVKNIPEGPVIGSKLMARVPPKERERVAKDIRNYLFRLLIGLTLPEGEATTLTEAARGTLLYSLVSDGKSNVPYRLRMITPSWYNLRPFMESLKGYRLMDLPAIYGSWGYFPPEADR